MAFQLVEYTSGELIFATCDWKEMIDLAKSGPVFRGLLHTGSFVSVQRLNAEDDDVDSELEFLDKLYALKRLSHPNLINVIGFCNEGSQRFLVYEYLSLQSNLEIRLHARKPNMQPLGWNTRMKIATGVARGLNCLHEAILPVMYKNLRSSRVLLGEFLDAKLADVWHLEVDPQSSQDSSSTAVMGGASGYHAPEVAAGNFTFKSDVYAYGILLFELITGLQAFDNTRGNGKDFLIDWVCPNIRLFGYESIIDPMLARTCPVSPGEVIHLAISCTEQDPIQRPSMAQVVQTMEVIMSELDAMVEAQGELRETHLGDPPISFSSLEIQRGTNFQKKGLIAQGDLGPVFRARLEKAGNRILAIKHLSRDQEGAKKVLMEVLMLSCLRHPNIVNLVGYCEEGELPCVVYEYMPQGCLDFNLHGLTPRMRRLDWSRRMKIATGVARGMNYLHHEANPPVIYRNVKASNVLLDKAFNPKLSDFWIAEVSPPGNRTQIFSQVMGARAYAAPEYASTGKLSFKSDVYSYGVLLLEIVTGRLPLDTNREHGKELLVDWVRHKLTCQRNVDQADVFLEGQFPEFIFSEVVKLALKCTQDDPALRPSMTEVMHAMKYFSSEPYDRIA